MKGSSGASGKNEDETTRISETFIRASSLGTNVNELSCQVITVEFGLSGTGSRHYTPGYPVILYGAWVLVQHCIVSVPRYWYLDTRCKHSLGNIMLSYLGLRTLRGA